MGTYYNDNGELKLISGATLWADAPIGAINAYGGATAPNGWLLCHGQAISRTDYAELFAVIGTAYGSGDGSTTFNVPDIRNKFLEGASTTNPVGTEKSAGLPNIKGNANFRSGPNHYSNFTDVNNAFKNSVTKDSSTSPFTTFGINESVSSYKDTLKFNANDFNSIYSDSVETVQPPAVCTNFIIKAKQVALPADFMDALSSKQDVTDNTLQTTSKTVPGAINELNSAITAKGQSVELYAGPGGNFTTPIPDDSKYLIVIIRTSNGGSTTKIYPTELIRVITIHESAYWNTVNIAGYEVLAVYDINSTSITPIVFSHGANTGDIAVTVLSIN